MDSELRRLQSENAALADELAQCQADKDFVWSLWKRLQVASPDITQAVGMIVEREKEKAELKDRKILEILSAKDDHIEKLENMVQTHDQEHTNLVSKNRELEDEVKRLKMELEDVQFTCTQLQNKVSSIDGKDNHQLALVHALEKERQDLNEKLSEQIIELTRMRSENDDIGNTALKQEENIQSFEREKRDLSDKFNKLTKEFEEYRRKTRSTNQQTEKLKQDVSIKDQEIEQLRRELSDVWTSSRKATEHSAQQAELIHQLQNLQQDTHQVLQNQEDGYVQELKSLEKKNIELRTQNEELKVLEDELRRELKEFQGHVQDQQGLIADLERQLEFASENKYTQAVLSSSKNQETQIPGYESDDIEVYFKVQSLQTENDVLRERLREKNNVIEKLKTAPHNKRRTGSLSPYRTRRDPSPNIPSSKNNDVNRRHDISKELRETKELLRLKTEEMESLQSAHKKRLDRLRSLQKNYRLVREQLKTLEEGQQKKKPPKIIRATPKELQREDSESVWNELTFYRTENKKLVVERMNMEEELDMLRVQCSQDAATIHELRLCLQHEKQELQQLLEDQEARNSLENREERWRHQADISTKQVTDLEGKVRHLEHENNLLEKERQRGSEERRALKLEMNEVKRDISDKRIEIADLKHDLTRVHKELRKQRKKANKVIVAKRIPQPYSQRSVRGVYRSDVLENEDEDWEEVTEDDDDVTDEVDNTVSTMETSESLGETIARAAQINQGHPSAARRERKMMRTVNTQTRKHVTIMREDDRASDNRDAYETTPRTVRTYDRATSPITIRSTLQPAPRTKTTKTDQKTEGKSSRQLSHLRQRLIALQQQVAIVRDSRDSSVRALTSQRERNTQLEQDLNFSNKQIKGNKDTIRRLQVEIERLRGDKATLEQQVLDTANSSGSQATEDHSVQNEVKQLQQRIKACSTEMNKLSSSNKALQSEKTELEAKIKELQDRISHQERDVNQKRALVEDYRIKLKLSQENAQSDAAVLEECEAKVKHLTESSEKNKAYSESLKKRLTILSKEKHENAERTYKLSAELEKKTKELNELQHHASDLQATLSEVEYAAQKQLHGLASQSEVAMDTAQAKISSLSRSVEEYQKLLQALSRALNQDVQQARMHVHHQKVREKESKAPPVAGTQDKALKNAESLACSILNISHNDLEDIMNADSDDEHKDDNFLKTQVKRDAKWSKKLEKTYTTQTNFAMPALEMLLEKIDERMRLLQQLQK